VSTRVQILGIVLNEWAFASSSEGIGFGPIGGSRKSEGNTSPRRGLSTAATNIAGSGV